MDNKLVSEFWENVVSAWPKYYKMIKNNPSLNLERVLNLITMLSGELSKRIDFEITYGEINRITVKESQDLVELYISPKLQLKNIPLLNLMIELIPETSKLPNLHVVKYRSYHVRDSVIASIEYNLSNNEHPQYHNYKYEDFGCQWFSGIDTTENMEKRPIINIVILVKKNAINLLVKKPVTFILADGKEEVIEKWLPSVANVIDLFLINMIGEYNLVNNVGYIEFLPEDDPLIEPGSEFNELMSLRASFQILNNTQNMLFCNVCGRYEYQTKLSKCSKCKKVVYCSKLCQKANFTIHKELCL